MEEMDADFDKILEILPSISLSLHENRYYPILIDIHEILDDFEIIKFALENYSSFEDELERYVLFLLAFKIMKMGECGTKEMREALAENTMLISHKLLLKVLYHLICQPFRGFR
ncbi:hypothetical protein [Lactobacillus delbrueckii]|uniref:hypothetical protein n=1 Tax=Lactobacillus delbrueckii TaxID=1584 RepID=UPI0007CD62B3|nr:hypothetical protein [Lactobacillus delbrueckii]